MNKIKSHIKELEERLPHTDVRKNSIILNELLNEEFEEIGSDGKISTREEVIEWLVNKEKNTIWSLNNFKIKELSPELILATYIAIKKINLTQVLQLEVLYGKSFLVTGK